MKRPQSRTCRELTVRHNQIVICGWNNSDDIYRLLKHMLKAHGMKPGFKNCREVLP